MSDRTVKRIVLPRPLPHQLPILLSGARFKAVSAGRRFGKSVMALNAAVEGHGPGHCFRGAANGGNVWIVLPTFGMATDTWRMLKAACGGALTAKSEQALRIDLPGGGALTVKSADNPDSLRGSGLSGVVLDEAAYIAPQLWPEVIRPALADQRGWALMISTPKGFDHFHEMWCSFRDQPEGEAWQLPTSDNPLIAPEEIVAAGAELPSVTFSQEFEAQFISASGLRIDSSWFRYYKPRRGVYECLDGDGFIVREVSVDDCMRFITCDPAGSSVQVRQSLKSRSRSWSVVMTFDLHVSTGTLFVVDTWRQQVEVPQLVEAIERKYDEHDPAFVGVENQGIGLAVYQTLQAKTGLPLRALRPQGRDKGTRSVKFEAMLESERVYFPQRAPWLRELEGELLQWSGHQDDTSDQLDCCAYAALCVGQFREQGMTSDVKGMYVPTDPARHGVLFDRGQQNRVDWRPSGGRFNYRPGA
jgi:predicted phage terminase large subunit-like protein